ncbi:hypothetical protein SARC_07440 [Sphaeroforma arctica JP610]|uniref:Uncharacterized protein n=1 Tax=Sphaeroforma arctica JP610 TaxID=667725 RepID=A0A0L0FTR3_9EUKA|nr:hypothetical protein SARC_07440 [Sphaeroforma arctica JP610]KNC80197.1 hypothetical protein SARC_07440 [Sphaeroforma arctica JP610]|eukprot:XP_014154099.1 hypothetical protein SARC_07440 [Sphaeroforma arctica JP610]
MKHRQYQCPVLKRKRASERKEGGHGKGGKGLGRSLPQGQGGVAIRAPSVAAAQPVGTGVNGGAVIQQPIMPQTSVYTSGPAMAYGDPGMAGTVLPVATLATASVD